ncbi:MAG: transporter substrate-binding domain-containing protein [Acidobacteriota bacterium]
MEMLRRSFGCLALALLSTLAMAPWVSAAPSAGPAAPSLEEIQSRGTLVLLCFPHTESEFVRADLGRLQATGQPLTELRDPSAFSGIDIDLISAFAESLGVELEIQPVVTSYSDLIPALLRGEGDLVASSFTITEARSKTADFSRPYLSNWVVVGAKKGSGIRSVEDLAGLRVAVMRGSSQLEFLRGLDIPGLEVVLTDYSLENLVALEEGRVDFVLVDSWAEPGEPLGRGSEGLVVAFRLRSFDYGVAVAPGSDLRQALDRFLEQATRSGQIARIVERYR